MRFEEVFAREWLVKAIKDLRQGGREQAIQSAQEALHWLSIEQEQPETAK